MDVFADQGKVRAIYHVSVGVSDIDRARRFYSAILSSLGYKLLHEVKEQGKITSLGWGLHFPELWTNLPLGGATPQPGSGIHVALLGALFLDQIPAKEEKAVVPSPMDGPRSLLGYVGSCPA